MRMSALELVAELNQVRHIWVEHDAQTLKDHRAAEKAALKEWKTRLREAIKADYETAKQEYCWTRTLEFKPPTCPMSRTKQIDRLIKQVELSNQKVYTIKPNGANASFFHGLMDRPNQPKDMCDD